MWFTEIKAHESTQLAILPKEQEQKYRSRGADETKTGILLSQNSAA